MTLLLSAPVGPYICDVPGDVEAMFSHVEGEPFWGRQYGHYVGNFLSYSLPWLQEHKQLGLPFWETVDVLSPCIRCGRLPSRSDVNTNTEDMT